VKKRYIFPVILTLLLVLGLVSCDDLFNSGSSRNNIITITVTGVTAPVAGHSPATATDGVSVSTGPDANGVSVTQIAWFAENGTTPFTGNFVDGASYVVRVTLRVNSGFNVTNQPSATINTGTATSSISGNTVVLSRTFSVTPPTIINAVTFTGIRSPVFGAIATVSDIRLAGTDPVINNIPGTAQWRVVNPHEGPFGAGIVYVLRFSIESPPAGYSFAGLTPANVGGRGNGGVATFDPATPGEGKLDIDITFPPVATPIDIQSLALVGMPRLQATAGDLLSSIPLAAITPITSPGDAAYISWNTWIHNNGNVILPGTDASFPAGNHSLDVRLVATPGHRFTTNTSYSATHSDGSTVATPPSPTLGVLETALTLRFPFIVTAPPVATPTNITGLALTNVPALGSLTVGTAPGLTTVSANATPGDAVSNVTANWINSSGAIVTTFATAGTYNIAVVVTAPNTHTFAGILGGNVTANNGVPAIQGTPGGTSITIHIPVTVGAAPPTPINSLSLSFTNPPTDGDNPVVGATLNGHISTGNANVTVADAVWKNAGTDMLVTETFDDPGSYTLEFTLNITGDFVFANPMGTAEVTTTSPNYVLTTVARDDDTTLSVVATFTFPP
jgi:hypothetical protein